MDFTTVRFAFTSACVAEVEVQVDRAVWEAMSDDERAQMAQDQAMDHGMSWSWQELKPAPAPVMAWVTTDHRGRVTDDATVTVGEWTDPVPAATATGSRMAPQRIGLALRQRGWQVIRDAEHDTTSQPGMVGIPVEPIKEG